MSKLDGFCETVARKICSLALRMFYSSEEYEECIGVQKE